MENQKLKNKIQEFCENKHLDKPFIQECITEFIEKHIELYGDVIPTEALFKRFEDNLDKISFVGPEKSPNGELGEYKGRIADNTDQNEILIYFNETDLDLAEMDKKMWNLYTESDRQRLLQNVATTRSEIKSTLMHELTHATYTIKDKYGIGEKHIFSNIGKDYLSGEYKQISGHNNNVEAIVNYISNRIEGKTPAEIRTYPAETKAIYMLTEKLDEKLIIQSAWNSDEQQFKKFYMNSITKDVKLGEKSYANFQEKMKQLVIMRNQNINSNEKNEKTLFEIQQILDGKTYETEPSTFKNIEHSASPNMPETEKEIHLSFSQKIAKFFKNHETLLNIPFVKNFVNKQLNVLSPAKKQNEVINMSSSTSQRDNFINEISNNGMYRKLEPIQPKKEIPNLKRTNEQDKAER